MLFEIKHTLIASRLICFVSSEVDASSLADTPHLLNSLMHVFLVISLISLMWLPNQSARNDISNIFRWDLQTLNPSSIGFISRLCGAAWSISAPDARIIAPTHGFTCVEALSKTTIDCGSPFTSFSRIGHRNYATHSSK